MRVLPAYPESEEAVLGAVLVAPITKGKELAGSLSPQHFTASGNGFVAEAIAEIVGRKENPDVVTVLAELKRKQVKIVDSPRLSQLAYAADPIGWDQHVSRLRDALSLRTLIQVASEAVDKAFALESPERVVAGLSERLVAISIGRTDSMKPADEVMRGVISNLEARKEHGGRPSGVMFGLRDLDVLTTGLKPPRLCVIAGATGGGKTSLAMQAVFSFARAGGYCAVFNLEMTAEELGERAIAHQEFIDSSELALGRISEKQWTQIRSRADELSKQSVHYEDRIRSVSDICARARDWRARHGDKPGLLVVDFLQLMRGSNPKDPRYRQVGTMAEDMKALAKELSVPIILLSQLSRSEEDSTPPTLSRLKESGDIENAADIVIAGHNPNRIDDGEIEIYVLKNRGGKTGRLPAHWRGKHYLLTGISQDEPF